MIHLLLVAAYRVLVPLLTSLTDVRRVHREWMCSRKNVFQMRAGCTFLTSSTEMNIAAKKDISTKDDYAI